MAQYELVGEIDTEAISKNHAFATKGARRQVRLGESIPLSIQAWKKLMSMFGPAVVLTFLGSFLQSDGSRVVVLSLEKQGSGRQLFYNLGASFPAEVKLSGVTFSVHSVSDHGNWLEIEVP